MKSKSEIENTLEELRRGGSLINDRLCQRGMGAYQIKSIDGWEKDIECETFYSVKEKCDMVEESGNTWYRYQLKESVK